MKHKSAGRLRQERKRMVTLIVSAVLCLLIIGGVIVVLRELNKASVVSSETSIETLVVTESVIEVITDTTTSEPTATPEPTMTPTPSPTPTPSMLTSLDGYEPGAVIEDTLIDTANLSQYFTISEITEGDNIYQRIAGQSFVYNNDIALSDLRYLKMLHVNFDGNYQVGEMIVNASVAQQVTEIFELLCEARYEIYSMYLIDDFWVGNGTDSDTNSIDHNNTSCFCYRPASGGGNLSRHAMGLAIDLNPQQNPYVRINADGSLSCEHENAYDYMSNRTSDMPHVITESDYAYQLFTARGWTWGGNWNNPKDYQHFQL